jgi:magnesium transporter
LLLRRPLAFAPPAEGAKPRSRREHDNAARERGANATIAAEPSPCRARTTSTRTPHAAENGRVIVDCALYADGKREPVDLAQAVSRARHRPNSFVWLGLQEPTNDEFDDLALYFAPHPLAIEDAINAHQRPKLDIYDECLFVVIKTLCYDDRRLEIETGEIMLFTGENFMVTVQHGPGDVLEPVRRRLENLPELLRHGPSAVLYGICDAVVDGYEHIAEEVGQDLEELERKVFASEGGVDAARIYALKRQVLEFRHAVMPLAQPVRVLTGAQLEGIHPAMEPYFRDVGDHLARVTERVEAFDSLLTDIFTANLAQITIQQNDEARQQNEDTRRISAWVAIVAADTVITGVYGMNFDYMPELHTRYSYYVCLAVMLLLDVTLYRQFRRSGWL